MNTPCWKGLEPGLALCSVAIQEADEIYRELQGDQGVPPTTLLVSDSNAYLAYEVVIGKRDESGTAPCRYRIVTVPGLPEHFWAVCGPHGVVYSDMS